MSTRMVIQIQMKTLK